MSREKHEDDCPGCLPALCQVDEATGATVALPADHPDQVKVLKWWKTVSRADKEAFHRFTCNGSKADADLMVIGRFIEEMKEVLK